MKFFTLLAFLFCLTAQAYELKEGFFHGTGEMKCNFINGKVTRPDALTWEIRKESSKPLRYEILGGISTINSVPLHFFAVEGNEGEFDLINEGGKVKGSLSCVGIRCFLKYHFWTNFIQQTKVPQSITAEWTWDKSGFYQVGKLRSLIPYDRLELVN